MLVPAHGQYNDPVPTGLRRQGTSGRCLQLMGRGAVCKFRPGFSSADASAHRAGCCAPEFRPEEYTRGHAAPCWLTNDVQTRQTGSDHPGRFGCAGNSVVPVRRHLCRLAVVRRGRIPRGLHHPGGQPDRAVPDRCRSRWRCGFRRAVSWPTNPGRYSCRPTRSIRSRRTGRSSPPGPRPSRSAFPVWSH